MEFLKSFIRDFNSPYSALDPVMIQIFFIKNFFCKCNIKQIIYFDILMEILNETKSILKNLVQMIEEKLKMHILNKNYSKIHLMKLSNYFNLKHKIINI